MPPTSLFSLMILSLLPRGGVCCNQLRHVLSITCKEASLKFMGYIYMYKAQSTHTSSPRQEEKENHLHMLTSIAYLGAVVRSALDR